MTVHAKTKQVEVECIKWNGNNNEDVEVFCDGKVKFNFDCAKGDNVAVLHTYEDAIIVYKGDIIIKEANGTLHPCSPEVFNKTYEVVKDKPTSVELVETKHDLLTTKYTKVLEEKDYTSYAPCNFKVVRKDDGGCLAEIHFQDGPVSEGVNGCINEDLLIMVVRRLEEFQQSEFCCRENALAITHIEEALLWLRKRTMAREARGVEGTHTV